MSETYDFSAITDAAAAANHPESIMMTTAVSTPSLAELQPLSVASAVDVPVLFLPNRNTGTTTNSNSTSAIHNNTSHSKWSKNGFGVVVSEKQNGKFSRAESDRVRKAVEEFCHLKQIPIVRLCAEFDHKAELKGAWMEIAKQLPHRSVQSVYRHGIRQLHPFKRGPWSAEECMLLTDLVLKIGKKWSTIQSKLNRSADSCRDKYREMSDEFVKGRWIDHDIEMLKRIIREQLAVAPDMDMKELGRFVDDQNIVIPWSTISKRMGNRSRLSCFKKWQKLSGTSIESSDNDNKKRGEDDDHDHDHEIDGEIPPDNADLNHLLRNQHQHNLHHNGIGGNAEILRNNNNSRKRLHSELSSAATAGAAAAIAHQSISQFAYHNPLIANDRAAPTSMPSTPASASVVIPPDIFYNAHQAAEDVVEAVKLPETVHLKSEV